MFNRISELSKETLRGSVPAMSELGTEPLEALVRESETVQYVLTSASEVEHTTNGRTTTVEPGSEHAAYAVVTDQRVYVVLGDEPTTAAITVELGEITWTERTDGLLQTTLVLRTSDETITFEPTDSEQARAAETYIDRIGACWRDLDTALADARDALDAFEAGIQNGDETDRLRQQVRSRISKAYHCATRADEAPTEKMRATIQPVEDELERLARVSQTDRIEDSLADAREASDADDYETAAKALAAADNAIADARAVVGDEDVRAEIDDLDTDCDALVATYLDDAETACHEARKAETTAEAVADWGDALDRYRAALTAGWDGVGGVSAEALRFQLAWVVQHHIDALTADATRRENEGDDLGEGHDDTAEYYETAIERITRAQTLAADHPHATAESVDERLERLERKAERAQWQWGSAD